jgi:DNA gyrase/topoisomerase IV subunit A
VGERSGIGVVEVAILNALDELGARPDRGFRRSQRVLDVIEDRLGLAPGYAYQVLVDQALWWTVPVPLLAGQGNFGGRGFDPPADAQYTEVRLSRAGAVVLAAERGGIAPVPVGLINGNAYREGLRPPFRPAGVIAAIREVLRRRDVPGAELAEIVGLPVFPTGHAGAGDLAGLVAGRETDLRLVADVTVGDDGRKVIVTNIPFGVSTDDVAATLADRASRYHEAREHPGHVREGGLPIADVRDETTEAIPNGRCVVIPVTGTSAAELRGMLANVPGVYTIIPVRLPRSLPAMIRDWVRAHDGEDLPASLTALEQAIGE